MKRKHIIFYLFTPLFLEWGISFAMQMLAVTIIKNVEAHLMMLTFGISLVTIPAAFYLYHKDGRESGEELIIPLGDWVKIAVIGIVACIALNMGISFLNLQQFSGGYQQVSETIYESSRLLQVLTTVVAAPILEELIYRGLLYGRMREMVSPVPAILCSSLVFGICHGNLVQFVFACGIGILLSCVYEKYGKIATAIWMHMTVNLTSLILTWVLAGV